MKYKLLVFILLVFKINNIQSQTSYFEDFNTAGYPSGLPVDSYWAFYNEIDPTQDTWEKFIPGDGFAYLKVDADITNDTDLIHPYQTLIFGGVGENHSLEVRMKGAVVAGGLVAFLFTYTQTGSIFNEVDIEVVAQDRDAAPHDITSPNGWTDARFNTWRDADENTALPHTGSAKAVVNVDNQKISLMDDEFHTYTIEWRSDSVDFFIDGVLQDSFDTNIAKGWSEVIIGFRNLPWAGNFNWTGTHTLVIDYFKIESIKAKSVTLSNNSTNDATIPQLTIYPNPANELIHVKTDEPNKIANIEIINTIGSSILKINGFQNQIHISQFSNGIYFIKTHFKNGASTIQKLIKK